VCAKFIRPFLSWKGLLHYNQSMDIDISHNIDAIGDMMLQLGSKEISKAVKVGLNHSVKKTRNHAIKILKTKYNKQQKKFYASRMKMIKAKGSSIPYMEAKVIFSARPIPMLDFVSGQKGIIKQKGIKVKRRRKLSATVYRGKKIQLKGAFIQKKNTTQVFKGKRGDGFKKQGVPSLAHTFTQEKVIKQSIMGFALFEFNKEFTRFLQFRSDKLADFASRSRVKKVK